METVPLDIPVNFLTGSLIMLAAGRGIRAGADLLGRPFRAAVAYSLWFGLTVTYFYFVYPDWMYAYFLELGWVRLIIGWFVFMAALAAAGACGALATGVWLKRGRRAWIPALYGLVNWLVVMGFTYDQYFHVGTLAQYRAGQAQPLGEHEAMRRAMSIAGPLEIAPLLLIILVIWVANRKQPVPAPVPVTAPEPPTKAGPPGETPQG
jgi:hypothetical protein